MYVYIYICIYIYEYKHIYVYIHMNAYDRPFVNQVALHTPKPATTKNAIRTKKECGIRSS